MPVIRDRLIKGDSRYAVDYITDAHAGYKYYHNRWQFLGDSYTGGYDFFASRYLEPYYYESRDDYEKRLRQVALDNHVFLLWAYTIHSCLEKILKEKLNH